MNYATIDFCVRPVGFRQAMEPTLTNRILPAGEAQAWGIITRVAADDELAATAEALATQMARGPTGAFGVAKQLMDGGLGAELESQMEAESRAIAQAVQGAEGREGTAAFIEKRWPNFNAE